MAWGIRICLPMQGNTGSILGSGRFYMIWSKLSPGISVSSLCSRAHEPQLLSHMLQLLKPDDLESVLHNKRSHHSKKASHHNKE